MKKILSIFNPKNYSMTTQVFLIFFITFIIFLFTEILVVNSINNNTHNDIQKQNQLVSSEFFNQYNENQNNFLLMQEFYDTNYSYIITIDKNFELIQVASSILIKLKGSYYTIALLYEDLKVGDVIGYSLDSNNNITKINNYLYINEENTTFHEGEIEDIIYPESINYLFYNNNEVHYILNELKKSTITQSIYITNINHNNLTMYVFVKPLIDSQLIIIMPSLDNTAITYNLTIFQIVMFFAMLIILLILTFLINRLLAEPIKDIVFVLKSNKNLNTEIIHAKEHQNKEYKTLSNEINDLSDSLIDIIENLNSKNNEITKYNEELNKEYEYKKQLVATISHEIKTPLAAMQATISGILDGIFEGEEANVELQNVLNEIESTNSMLQEIVQLYQLENNNFKLDLQLINLTSLINESINQCQKIAQKYNQNIIFTFSKSLYAFIDNKQMTRVINNLILNAIIYSPSFNKITIEIKEFITHNILEIINYGTNIPNVDIDKLFEPFYRVDKSRNKSEDHGNGLGLYLVSETLKKHGFEYGIENVINGVKFYIIFPRSNDDK